MSDPAELHLEHLRHSLAHLLAAAVLKLYPDAKPTIGPAIDNGFYYDFQFSASISDKDLSAIETTMKKIVKHWKKVSVREVGVEEARDIYRSNPFKIELIDEISNRNEPITLYRWGDFEDLCRGGHLESAQVINSNAFTLSRVAGAYWRGSEKNPMLTRIYGLAFVTPEELKEYQRILKEAEERDHRKLGKELKLFAFSDYVGPGLPLWLPNGTVLTEELERLAKETEFRAGYKRVRTPHIAKEVMYTTSGHLPYYAESMFPPMVLKEKEAETTYYLKAMNCPHHHQVYAAEPHSYRDLPLRLAEYGTCYRYEQSGELMGLMRVRSLNMNDAHIYCTTEQFAQEFRSVNEMYLNYFTLFGFKKYVMRFSTHDPKELGKKYIDNAQLWKQTEDMVRAVLIESKIDYVEVPNEAAFYGPKIDVQVWSSIGREFTIATNQVDFAVPGRFGLTYTDSDGTAKTPICIHRAPLGTHERFIGFLIEHYGGAFPVWLSPVQVAVVPVGESFVGATSALHRTLINEDIRSEHRDDNESVGYKIRATSKEKIPYVIVVGEREAPEGSTWTPETMLSVRVRGQEALLNISLGEFLKRIQIESKERRSAVQ